jgi:hypothetical protein
MNCRNMFGAPVYKPSKLVNTAKLRWFMSSRKDWFTIATETDCYSAWLILCIKGYWRLRQIWLIFDSIACQSN